MPSSCGGSTPMRWRYRCRCASTRVSSPRSMPGWPRRVRPRYHRPPDSFPHLFRAMDTKLLELLVCPVTKGPLTYDRERQELVSRSARLAYPVRDGIPVLLENEARTLTDEELEKGACPPVSRC